MTFTDKFTFMTSALIVSCMLLILIGGALSLHSLSLKYDQEKIERIIYVIESQLDKQAEQKGFNILLLDLLDASGVVRLQLKRKNEVLFQNYYQSRKFFPDYLLIRSQYKLERHENILLILHTRRDDIFNFPLFPLLILGMAVFITFLLFHFYIRWIKRFFYGVKLLEKRSQYILKNNPTARLAQVGEWPPITSKALDMLNQKLADSTKERSYFDEYIRGKAFLDETTGFGNRLAFENQLDVIAVDRVILSSALLQINFLELESIEVHDGEEKNSVLLLQITELLIEFTSHYADPFCGRIEQTEFALILPQMSYEETKIAAKKLTKLLLCLQLPEALSMDDFFHVGVVNFYCGEKAFMIMDDLNHASRVAKHQTSSTWFLADQYIKKSSLLKGTVRWRALLEKVLENDMLLLHHQRLMLRDSSTELYSEIGPRIMGDNGDIITSSIFLPMAKKCGLQQNFDIMILEKVLLLLVTRGEKSTPIGINLSANILMDRIRMKWFVFELMQLSRALRQNLVIEVFEHLLVDNYYPLRNSIIALQKVGCKIAIDNVGKSIINTGYIIDLSVSYLKIHPGLIRDIHLRKTNQTALQSLLASCISSPTKMIAIGLENDNEWQCLLKLGFFAGQGPLFSTEQPLST